MSLLLLSAQMTQSVFNTFQIVSYFSWWKSGAQPQNYWSLIRRLPYSIVDDASYRCWAIERIDLALRSCRFNRWPSSRTSNAAQQVKVWS